MSVAIVTGASSGLGRVISQALLGAGWQVALAGRREELLEETAAGAPDGAALVVPADVTSAESVAALFDAVRDRWGRLDLLVNNAGLFGPAAQADEIDLADWQRVVDTNLTGAFLCAQHAVRMMKAQDPRCGRIDIGNAETELTKRFSQGVLQANGSIAAEPVFDSRHVADAVLYMASLPLDANVQFLTITATTMPFIGRG